MIRRLLAAMFAAALIATGLTLMVGTAHAAPAGCPTSAPEDYKSDTCGMDTDKDSGQPGDDVEVKGEGFTANCGVSIRFDGEEIGHTTTDANGNFDTHVTIPSDAKPGTHRLTSHDLCSTLVLGQNFEVLGNGSGLPFTGFVFWPLLGGGAALVLFGGALVFAGRRRRLSPIAA
ncbi:MAG: hypothetical protein QOG53_1869 [Frankiales bacterium]|jgi:hypothetical protein|nr:hypothetical protein [Frankiales bacterium]